MGDLRVENPKTTEAFVAALAEQMVKLPLGVSEDEPGVVFDADGETVFVVDVNNERPDDQVEQIAMWIVLAVNTCGGFKLEMQ
ncbi:hypothetical protein [Allomesorhizobium camelthorni]|uniref:Uncharacterized protein n=1 Tax=Allomesorhizobium camelthorni TaxID=475069 RepID=A0A6G4W6V6_9HYPH|nr:hypothetical protein [Mesorhizobium camelthorni]NGO50481.1 hypothetical protein [Mesorhizobium camelthorni]